MKEKHIIKLKDDVNLDTLLTYGFEYDDHCPSRIEGKNDLIYELLRIDIVTREITIDAYFDHVTGSKELYKFYELYINGLVEVIEV